MSNNIDWIEIDSVKNALMWFEKNKEFESKYRNHITGEEQFSDCKLKNDYYKQGLNSSDFPTELEPDSSPKAWEHYIRHYIPKTFGETLDEYQTNSKQNYSFERLKYDIGDDKGKPRVFAVPKRCAQNRAKRVVIKDDTGKAFRRPERLGGDCDFNFNKSKYQIFIKRLLGLSSKDNVNIEENLKHPQNDSIELLNQCHSMHHTFLNFSLIQGSGGMNNLKGAQLKLDGEKIKENPQLDRLDKFVTFLDEFFRIDKNDDEKQMSKLKAGQIGQNNVEFLHHYLNQFSNIYDYCAKIYFLPTTGYFTGMMKELNADLTKSAWRTLLDNNQKLIDDLIEFGKETLDPLEHIIKYMLIAVRFWQSKEQYFELMDSIIDSNETK